ncbi:MAG: MFS transporter [Firmicutes bacterium]|nr:MFS transporter [Bacillota bacterium]
MNKKSQNMLYISIFTLFICSAGGTLENTAMQTMMEAWPSVSPAMIRLLTTLPPFISMFAMIGVGRIVGKYISYKTSICTGLILMLSGGLLPFFLSLPWNGILVCRIAMGLGVGMSALGNPLFMLSVPANHLARYIGIGGIVGSVCNMLLNPIVGTLTKVGWKYAFLSNLVYIIPFLMCLFFLKEPEQKEKDSQEENKETIPSIVYMFIGIQFLSTMTLYPLLSGISTYVSALKVGDVTFAGILLSVYTFGGLTVNLFLPRIKKALGNKLLFIAYLLVCLGVSLVIFVPNKVLLIAGIFMSGTGFIASMQMLQVYCGNICSPSQMANASTMILASNQFGVLLSTFFMALTKYISLFAYEMQNTLLVCLIVYLLLAVFAWKYKLK